MPIPALRNDGTLPPGIYRATLAETLAVFGQDEGRRDKGELLTLIVAAAGQYATIKRVLVWGSFVTGKPDPADLDYSVVVEAGHKSGQIQPEHRRFFVPSEARQFYGTDTGYLLLYDFPIEKYAEQLLFLCRDKNKQWRGIVEVQIPYGE